MQLIVPKKSISKRTQTVLKVIVGIITIICFTSMFFCVIAMISDDVEVHLLGMYFAFIPLGIIVLQIAVGIIVKIFNKPKK